MLESLFENYFEKHNNSFLEGDFDTREEIAKEYLDLLNSGNTQFKMESDSFCDWADANCFLFGGPCPEEADSIYPWQNKCADEIIVYYDCRKQESTTDCDNSYYWTSTNDVYNNPDDYEFIWYTNNIIYRFWMDDVISGWRLPSYSGYATFVGATHQMALGLAWPGFCSNDHYIEATRFGAIKKGITLNKYCNKPHIVEE